MYFSILVSEVTFAQKLKGTLTYMLEDKESTLQEKLDFVMHFPCSKFMCPMWDPTLVTDLIKSGQLVYENRNEVVLSQDFDEIAPVISAKCNLGIVQEFTDTATMYMNYMCGRSIKGHHVCIYFKYNVSDLYGNIFKFLARVIRNSNFAEINQEFDNWRQK